MCLNLIGSKYKTITEIEYLLRYNTTHEAIIEAKDSRKAINHLLKLAKSKEYIEEMGL